MCGQCCSHLRIGDEKAGLTLFPEEVYLFPEKTVRPHYGKGVSQPSIIFTYQHTENVCVHLKNNMCSIYDTRPLMCRSFPVKIGANGFRFSKGCKAVISITRSGMDFKQTSEVQAAIEMTERLAGFNSTFNQDEQMWKYNLILEQWEII
jgi:Fe-S-cluster containining protein